MDKIEIIKHNLIRTDEEFAEISEIRAAHIDEAAENVAAAFHGGSSFFAEDDFPGCYEKAKKALFETYPETRTEAVNYVFASLRQRGALNIEKAFFCRCIYDHAKNRVGEGMFFDDEEGFAEPGSVSFVENELTFRAFKRFSESMGSLKWRRCLSFEEVCENVSSSVSEYCILPIENSEEGELGNFTVLASDHGLKKFMQTSIYSEGDRYADFALCRKGLLPLPPSADGRLLAELMIPFDRRSGITEFMLSTPLYGAELFAVKTLHGSHYISGNYRYLITLRLERKDLERLLFCL